MIKDSYILTKDRKIVKCLNIAHRNGEPIIIGKYFKFMSAFFDDPIDSTILDIFLVENLVNKLNYWTIPNIKKKMMVLKYNGKLVASPIIHTNN